jgi:hypothetical protein
MLSLPALAPMTPPRALVLAGSVLLSSLFASGSQAAEPPPGAVVENDEPPEPPLVPAAEDRLGGHLTVTAGGGVLLPFGSYDRSMPAREAGVGLGGAADISIGITRAVAFGVYGRYFTHRFSCDACRSETMAVGPFVAYHAVQGLRFDPWILVGVSYERATVSQPGRSARLAGLDWLRVAVGGDYYAFSGLALGPFVELDFGTFFERSASAAPATVHGAFLAGLRLGFDTPGR